MCTAARSSRTSTMRMPSASARIQTGMMCPPQRAKMRSTPRALRKRATTPAAELADGMGGFTSEPRLWTCVHASSGACRRRARPGGATAFGEQLAPLRRIASPAPLRGQARSQRVERLAELVDGAEELSLQRSDDQTAASRVTHESLCLEDGERLSDGLTGDAKAGGEAVLVQPLASRQPPGADRFEDGFVGLLDERRAGPQRLDRRVPHSSGVRTIARIASAKRVLPHRLTRAYTH